MRRALPWKSLRGSIAKAYRGEIGARLIDAPMTSWLQLRSKA